jgi:Ca2+-binding RTX toxin-like protein
MSAFRFETISVQDAAGFGATDTLQFGGANAAQVAVLFVGDHVNIAFDGRSMDFGAGIEGQTGTRFADGSMLYVGSAAADSVAGTAFGDGLYGGLAGDSLDGGDGADLLQGNQGDDVLAGGLGADVAYGGQDNDQIRLAVAASSADETNFANGNKGDDVIVGGPGRDTILGGQGGDVLAGGAGGDFLNGNLGDDIVGGDAGDDTIAGEGGADFLSGGDGADLFQFAAGSSNAAARQLDTIQDWTSVDHVHIDGARAGFAAVTAPLVPGYSSGGYSYGPMPGDDSYDAMLGQANAALAGDPTLGVVAAKVGEEVILFADTDNDRMADLAILLQGATLFDVTAANLI